MSRILKFTQFLGVFPLKVESNAFQLSPRFWPIFNQIWITSLALWYFVDGIYSAKTFSKLLFSVIDRLLLIGVIPANMLVLWKLRLQLLETWNKSLTIARMIIPTWRQPSISLNSYIFNTIAIIINMILSILFIRWWTKIETISIGFALIYSLIEDMVFIEVYSINTSAFKVLNDKLKEGGFSEIQLKRLRKLYLALLLNTRKMSSVFDFFLLTVVVNFFGQIVACYDFATSELSMDFGQLLVVFSTFGYQFCRFICVVWAAQAPCSAVSIV